MFTIIISEQKHIDKVKEYEGFLKPLMNEGKFAFCQWNPEGENIEEALPTLVKTVGNRNDWRAIAIVDSGLENTQNPFDFLKWQMIGDCFLKLSKILFLEELYIPQLFLFCQKFFGYYLL